MQGNTRKIASTFTGMVILSSIVAGGFIPAHASTVTSPIVAAAAVSTDAVLPDVKSQESQVKEFERLINDFRAEYGLPPLKFNAWAAQEAQNWSKTMMNRSRLEHASRADFYQPLEGTYRMRSENIAASSSTNVESMFNQWKNSAAHRAAMLSEDATSFGIGFSYPTSDPKGYKMYGTTVFHAGHEAYVPETYASATSYFANAAPLSTSTAGLARVTPATPTFAKGKVTIPSTPGVRYYYPAKDMFLSAGTHTMYGQYTNVTAVALPGYHIASSVRDSWNYTNFESGNKFPIDVIKPQIYDNSTGGLQGYNLSPNMYFDYYVNGILTPPDFYEVNDNRTVTISVQVKPALNNDYYITDSEPVVHTFGTKSIPAKPVSFNHEALEYTVPSVANVSYIVNGAVKAPGTYKAKAGDALDIKVAPAVGYSINNAPNFNVVYTFPGPAAPIEVSPTAPTFNNNGTAYTIPSKTGVTYRVNGTVRAAGTHRVSAGDKVDITAHANTGYKITGISSWSHHFIVQTTAPTPTFNLANSSYVVPSSSAVDYHVNGAKTAPGEYVGATGVIRITATAKTGYSISGTVEWVQNFEDKKIAVIASAPTYNQVDGTITIPAVTGVEYLMDGSPKAAGTYPAKEGTTVVTARAKSGYVISGNSSWDITHKAPTVTKVTPAAPVFNEDSYLIPATTGVQYYVDGVAKGAGTHFLAVGTINVTAKALNGYQIIGTASWSHTRATPPPVVESRISTIAPKFSLTDGIYTIPAVNGSIYKVDGKVTATGVYKASRGTTVRVTVEAKPGYVLLGDTKWSKAFPTEECKSPTFSDATPEGSFWESINWLYCEGVTIGRADGSFGKGKEITRGEAASFLYRIAASDYSPSGEFKDVKKTSTHYKAIGWMHDQGYSLGYSDGTFRPNRPVTRGELASFIYRVSGANHNAPAHSPFRDMTPESSHYTAVTWLNAKGASTGYVDGTFRSKRYITRGETSKLLYVLR